MSDAALFGGIDLGGTKILVLVADARGQVVGSARVATDAARGPEPVIDHIINATNEAAAEAHVAVTALRGVGVSAPGPVETAEGVITQPPNLPGWRDVPLARILTDRLKTSVVLENDANCGAVGEHRFGAGRGYRHMLFVTISTGIGGGIIIEDKLYAGASGAAGEVGHIGVSVEGPVCGAGHVGCLEAFASGTAIAARAHEAIAAGELPLTASLAEKDPPLSAETVYEAARQGESGAAAIIKTAGQYLGIGLASLINAFNPQAIIMGGGLTNMGQAILGPALETARARSFAQSFADARIVVGELGERAPALGAIAVAKDRDARGVA